MNDDVCNERHKQVDLTLEKIENRQNSHSEEMKLVKTEIAELRKENAEFRIMIQNLCKDIKSLNDTLRWFLGLSATSMLGFFMYAAQKVLIR